MLGYYLSDFKFLSDNEVLAVGSAVGPAISSGKSEGDTAVVLYSSDGGKNWRIVYSGQSSGRIKAITEIGKERYFVSGINGFAGILERKQ